MLPQLGELALTCRGRTWQDALRSTRLPDIDEERRVMKTIGLGIATLLFNATALATPKPCEELKAKIETKVQSAGVTSYTLEIMRNDEVSDPNMAVNGCENGTRKIIY